MTRRLGIDVHFDLVCPWCWIGKRQLDQALTQAAHIDPDLRVATHWHAAQLLPGIPDAGLDFYDFYRRRLGSESAVRARQQQVREAAAVAGLQIDFARMQRMPNTRKAHQLLAFAAQQAGPVQVDALRERLFAGYFQQGDDLGDAATLHAMAHEQGLDTEDLQAWLHSGQGVPRPLNLSGVPLFVFDQARVLSGAQNVPTLLAAMGLPHTEVQASPA